MNNVRVSTMQSTTPTNVPDVLDSLLGPDTLTPQVRAIAVNTINGSCTLDGVSGGLGNELDFQLLLHLRAWSDVIVVSSGTVLAESYGGVEVTASYQKLRMARGQAPVPPLAILTKSVPFHRSSKVLAKSTVAPLIVTTSEDAPRTHPIRDLLSGVIATDTSSPEAIITALRDEGFSRILIEGGPQVYGQFFHAGCVDTLHLTIDPRMVFPNSSPLFPPTPQSGASSTTRFTVEQVTTCDDGVMFVRYSRATHS